MLDIKSCRGSLGGVDVQSNVREAELKLGVALESQSNVQETKLVTILSQVIAIVAFEPAEISGVVEFATSSSSPQLSLEKMYRIQEQCLARSVGLAGNLHLGGTN